MLGGGARGHFTLFPAGPSPRTPQSGSATRPGATPCPPRAGCPGRRVARTGEAVTRVTSPSGAAWCGPARPPPCRIPGRGRGCAVGSRGARSEEGAAGGVSGARGSCGGRRGPGTGGSCGCVGGCGVAVRGAQTPGDPRRVGPPRPRRVPGPRGGRCRTMAAGAGPGPGARSRRSAESGPGVREGERDAGCWGTGAAGRGERGTADAGGSAGHRGRATGRWGVPQEGGGVGVCPMGQEGGCLVGWRIVTRDGHGCPGTQGEGAVPSVAAAGQREVGRCCGAGQCRGARCCVRLQGTCGACFRCPGLMGMVGARGSPLVSAPQGVCGARECGMPWGGCCGCHGSGLWAPRGAEPSCPRVSVRYGLCEAVGWAGGCGALWVGWGVAGCHAVPPTRSNSPHSQAESLPGPTTSPWGGWGLCGAAGWGWGWLWGAVEPHRVLRGAFPSLWCASQAEEPPWLAMSPPARWCGRLTSSS